MDHPTLRLRPKADARVRAGHRWVFANEVDGPVRGLQPGATVDVIAATGAFLGRGFANPQGQVVAHLLASHRREDIDAPDFLRWKLRDALSWRERVGVGRDFRWVNAEGDGLPGLELDRFGDWAVARWALPGWNLRADALAEAVRAVWPEVRGGLVRGPEGAGTWFGEPVPERVSVEDGGVSVLVDPWEGEGTGHDFALTGWRREAAERAKGGRLLDAYGHGGAFALHALAAGASEAMLVEKLEARCALAADADPRVVIVCDEAGRTLEKLVGLGERFDVVVVDPPPFAKTRKNLDSALEGYTRIHGLGMALTRPGGWMLACLRSVHVDDAAFLGVLAAAGQQAGRSPRVFGPLPAPGDHPLDPAVPEGRGVRAWWVGV